MMRAEEIWGLRPAQFILPILIAVSITVPGPPHDLNPPPETKMRQPPPLTSREGWDRSVIRPSEVPRQTLALVSATDLPTAQQLANELARRHSLIVDSVNLLTTTEAALIGFRIPDARLPRVLVGALGREPSVIVADVNTIFETQSDLLSEKQYGLRLLQVDRLHPVLGGRGILVGIVDTEVDDAHENLRGAIDAQITDAEGAAQKSLGWHGTAVAGIIAARQDNGRGIRGVAPMARIIAIQACDPREADNARCEARRIIWGIDEALNRKARVINLSIAGPRNKLLTLIILRAIHVHNAAVVVAAGDSGPDGPPLYPAALPDVIGVGASDAEDRPYRQSNSGPYVSLLAPGVNILTTFPGNRYELATGTSFAAAHVSGAVALLMEADPGRAVDRLTRALIDGATPVGNGRGRVDICRSLAILGRQDACR